MQPGIFDSWFKRRTQHDLVTKMNAGNGKTLAGVMLLKSSLNEHTGPVAYLTPGLVYLVDQARPPPISG